MSLERLRISCARNRIGFILRYVRLVIPFIFRRDFLTALQGRIPDVILACIQYLREKFPAVRVSVEAEKPARPGLQELAVEADVVFYSKSWAQVFIIPTAIPWVSLMVNRDKDINRPRSVFESKQN